MTKALRYSDAAQYQDQGTLARQKMAKAGCALAKTGTCPCLGRLSLLLAKRRYSFDFAQMQQQGSNSSHAAQQDGHNMSVQFAHQILDPTGTVLWDVPPKMLQAMGHFSQPIAAQSLCRRALDRLLATFYHPKKAIALALRGILCFCFRKRLNRPCIVYSKLQSELQQNKSLQEGK